MYFVVADGISATPRGPPPAMWACLALRRGGGHAAGGPGRAGGPSASPLLPPLEERAHEFLVFQPDRRTLGCERGDAPAVPRLRGDHRRAAPGLNGSLKSRDRSLVFGGEPHHVGAVGDGLLLQRAEGLLISGDGGELDTQEVVESFDHVVGEKHTACQSRSPMPLRVAAFLSPSLSSQLAHLPMQSVRRAEASLAIVEVDSLGAAPIAGRGRPSRTRPWRPEVSAGTTPALPPLEASTSCNIAGIPFFRAPWQPSCSWRPPPARKSRARSNVSLSRRPKPPRAR